MDSEGSARDSVPTHPERTCPLFQPLSKPVSPRLAWTMTTLGIVALVLAYCTFLLDRERAFDLGKEDGLFENLTSLFFLVAGGLCLAAFWQSRQAYVDAKRRNVWLLLLGLLFIFGGGEEISWGQRIFDIETPESIESRNLQREINIHNLDLFHRRDDSGSTKSGLSLLLSFERLFSLFWLGWCVVIPALNAFSPAFSRLMVRLRMPIVPLSIGLLFPINYAISAVLEDQPYFRADDKHMKWPLMEIKEFVFAALLAMGSYCLLRSRGRATRADVTTPSATLATEHVLT